MEDLTKGLPLEVCWKVQVGQIAELAALLLREPGMGDEYPSPSVHEPGLSVHHAVELTMRERLPGNQEGLDGPELLMT